VLHTLTRSADRGWDGPAGRVHRDLLRQAARDLDDPIYYVSGSPSMVVATFRLLRGDGIPADDLKVEAFRGYA
jgi:NAD(P)H-flavin reductase